MTNNTKASALVFQKRWDELSDIARWDWLINNRRYFVRINLDNDDTQVVWYEDDEGAVCSCFYKSIGRSDGVRRLLDALLIANEEM